LMFKPPAFGRVLACIELAAVPTLGVIIRVCSSRFSILTAKYCWSSRRT
jgi:hypothetical protein